MDRVDKTEMEQEGWQQNLERFSKVDLDGEGTNYCGTGCF